MILLTSKNVELSEVKSENGENQRKMIASERRIMTLVCLYIYTTDKSNLLFCHVSIAHRPCPGHLTGSGAKH